MVGFQNQSTLFRQLRLIRCGKPKTNYGCAENLDLCKLEIKQKALRYFEMLKPPCQIEFIEYNNRVISYKHSLPPSRNYYQYSPAGIMHLHTLDIVRKDCPAFGKEKFRSDYCYK